MKTNIKKHKSIAMLAPSFIAEFDYPNIITQLKELGFERVVELTFGAKMINREYHRILEECEKNKKIKPRLIISSVCPAIVEFINKKYPAYKNSIIKVDSPMMAMAKICRKTYPKHKIIFISPCMAKKQEAKTKGKNIIDEVICFNELGKLIKERKSKRINNKNHNCIFFDKFYNDYTKIYPASGGLSKTAHLKQVLKKGEEKILDGWQKVDKFMKNPEKNVRFLDATFCGGGCLGGPCISKKFSMKEKVKRLEKYMNISKKEDIPKPREGLIKRARGIKFSY